MDYILESNFVRIFLFFELTPQQGTHICINLHQFAQCVYIVFVIYWVAKSGWNLRIIFTYFFFRVGKSLACHSPAKWCLCA